MVAQKKIRESNRVISWEKVIFAATYWSIKCGCLFIYTTLANINTSAVMIFFTKGFGIPAIGLRRYAYAALFVGI